MTRSNIPTAQAVSPDSGQHWAAEGAWPVAERVHRIPLPLPMDGLKAVNVYVIETDDGLTLVDGGWAIEVARETLERGLRQLGAGFGDIRRFLVTHVHRDHYTMAALLGGEYGAEVVLGAGERPALDFLTDGTQSGRSGFSSALVSAGADDLAVRWSREGELPAPGMWRYPDAWLDGDRSISVGQRMLQAVHTPGHTPGHYVFLDASADLLFAGDHVLPTITPSIGFTVPPASDPLGNFMASLTKVRALPDVRVLPAHGPVASSSHARVDELLSHHEERLRQCLAAVSDGGATAIDVARQLGWTRHHRPFYELDVFNQGIAALETKAHLELLVARRLASSSATAEGGFVFRRAGA